jgi:uncharacterized membrane protein YheB (UPF0754 family)
VNKGTVSNLISAATFGTGLAMPACTAREFVVPMALFAFSGGITNALAVKMLFDRVPGLIGSGVIPARFREIRAKVKQLILEHFFDREHLQQFFKDLEGDIEWHKYLKRTPRSRGPLAGVIEKQWNKLTAPEVVQPIIDQQMEKLLDSSVGGMLLMVGVEAVKPVVNQFVSSFVASMQKKVLESASQLGEEDIGVELDEEKVIEDIRVNVDRLLEKKLEQLDAGTVKRMMEEVIRQHLGWLVVWGNVFGGLLGLGAAFLTRYYL